MFSLTILTLVLTTSLISFTEQSKDASRCFQFTWMGHKFNNGSVYINATCYDATKRNPGVPCVKPLVVSFDGSWPDVNHIWQNYPQASCLLADGDVCARYTYYFEGHADNSTYFCTRAVDNRGIAIKSGIDALTISTYL
ncbi:unnamed protein product [Arctia plantaginis]|uniref:Secreted protein n=1 Tax=Arctia plantaginis TaxID=874455 RepID=A0A8S0ZNJ0_ARCPL|nr:unnamed protein product [Arctia plantaginis]